MQAGSLWIVQAAQGDAEAQYNLGRIHRFGQGVPEDFSEARRLFGLAAAQGHAAAQVDLGTMHYSGKEGPQDFAEARRLLGLAAAQGEVDAQRILGRMHRDGQGGPEDLAEARQLLGLAEAQGDTDAQCMLAGMHYHGQGGPADFAEARRLYGLAAAQGSNPYFAVAQYNLGTMDRNGDGGPVDFSEARRLLGLAVSQGHIDAHRILGGMHYHGQGGAVDFAEARRLYGLAAAKGHAPAQATLGCMHFTGRGGAVDFAEARRLYGLAAAKGHADAQCHLGRMHRDGQGVQQGHAEAKRLLGLAAAQGHAGAQESLDSLLASIPWGADFGLLDSIWGADSAKLAVQTALATVSAADVADSLNGVPDNVLRTMAVLAEDLAVLGGVRGSSWWSSSPSERFVFQELKGNVVSLQKHLGALEPGHWLLLAPLLRSRVLIEPDSFTAEGTRGYAFTVDPLFLLEQRSSWISMLLRAIDGLVLLILRKQDALVLAKRLLASPRASDHHHGQQRHARRELTELLGAMGRAYGFDEPTLTVLRVLAFVREHSEAAVRLLSGHGHCYEPPPCSPPLEPLAAELPASSECASLLVEMLARLGTDALSLTMLRQMTLRAKRAAASSCRGLRALLAPHLRAATLHVLAEDATLDNAAFVARLPTLERLHVEGESFLCDGLDIPKLRSLPRIALKTVGAPAALFLGCVLSGGAHTIRLSNGAAFVSLQPIATRDNLNLAVSSAADLAVLLGSLSSNRGLKQLRLPLIICESFKGQLVPLGEMVVQLGQALRWSHIAPAAPPSVAMPDGALVGQRVRVEGLVGRLELNGRCGEATAFDAARGRYFVMVEGEPSPLLLRPKNLIALGHVAAGGGEVP